MQGVRGPLGRDVLGVVHQQRVDAVRQTLDKTNIQDRARERERLAQRVDVGLEVVG